MRVALISPFSAGPTRGNITTVRRIARHLPNAGCDVCLIHLDATPPEEQQLTHCSTPPVQLLHAFHAYHAGPAARRMAHILNLPYLMTITGSDLYEPAFRDHPATVEALAGAAAVCCFDQLIAGELADRMPTVATRLAVIPQGVEPLPDTPLPPRTPNSFIILLPAALRPVKGILEAIDALAPLTSAIPDLQLWLAGGTLDTAYAAQVTKRINGQDWVRWLGEVPHEQMGALYRSADLVLNSSQFEGGMANCLLEAMSCARPVLASDVPGNRSLIRHGETGWLYRDTDALQEMVILLAQRPGQREEVGQAASADVSDCFSAASEAAALQALYSRITRA